MKLQNFKEYVLIAHEGVDKSRFSMKLYRFISKYISFLFIKLNITPNQVTVAHNILEFLSLFLFLTGEYKLFYITIIILVIGGILDNVDGEIARVTGRTSLKGEYLDLIGHRIIHPMFFLFLSIGIFTNYPNIILLVLGALAALGYTISEISTNVYKQLLYDKGQANQNGDVLKKKHNLFSVRWWEYTLFCFDHIKLILFIALLLGIPHIVVFIYAPLFILRAIGAVIIKYSLLSN